MINIRKHVRKAPKAHKDRYYFVHINLCALAIIRAANLRTAWDIACDMPEVNAAAADAIHVQRLRGEFAEYVNFNKHDFCYIGGRPRCCTECNSSI